MYRLLIKNEMQKCYKSLFHHDRLAFQVPFTRCKSHYKSLELESNASAKDIKSAYYKLSLKHHPDKNDGSKESVEKFRQIAEAYEVLGNPDKKKAYDRDFNTNSDYGTGTDYQRDRYYTRDGYYYKTRPGQRTGKDQFYDYDEYIRQHYEKFYREREAEQENMRRYYHRTYNKDQYYYRSSTNQQRRPPNYPPQMTLKELFTSRTFRLLTALWIIIIIMSMVNDGDQVKDKERKPIYYNVNRTPNPKIYYDVKEKKVVVDDDDE